jgi:hypothetical protein
MKVLELVREALARREFEKLAAAIHRSEAPVSLHPPQSWFDDDDNPFEPADEAAS